MAKQENNTANNNDKDFPGYPHHPASEDITSANAGGKKSLDETTIMMPDVADIPGQENITAAPLGSLADVTISSAGEEDIVNGDSLDTNGDDDDVNIVMGTDADVTAEDLRMLDASGENLDTEDDINQLHAELDDTDDDGDPLNEAGAERDLSGSDLDVPGSEDDDRDENVGEEDEENNLYSLGGDNHESQEENKGE